jgi:hypothetical protein
LVYYGGTTGWKIHERHVAEMWQQPQQGTEEDWSK